VKNAIELEGLRKTFGPKVAVDGMDLRVPEGSLWGFIGPNGAGKTTTIRMIMSILFPDSGQLRVLDHASALEAKDRIGYLPEERGVYKKMRVGSFLRYVATLKGRRGQGIQEHVRAWLERLGLADVEKKRCEELSKGMQQKVQFIAAVIHEPELLILDEPFSGLDPVNMRLLRDLVLEQHRRGATIIFSTHVMIQAEQLCEHIVMINEGRKVLDQPLAEVRSRFDPRTILFEPLHEGVDEDAFLRLDGVERVTRNNGELQLHVAEGAEPRRVIEHAVSLAVPAKVELHRPSLEDVFIEIVCGSESDQEARRIREELRANGPAALGEAS
jgi:ABC-2 type transport system ATP-binding protein